jgi:CheY-like chemotaxis protein
MPHRTLNILVADDAPEIRQLIAIALRRQGCRVVGCANGLEAVTLAHAEAFDVIVLDNHMPVLDGVSAARMLREDPETEAVPLVCISAALPEGATASGGPLFDRFVPKPLSPRELVSVVKGMALQPAS